MKKIFIVAGELSGDQTGAWYLNKLKRDYSIDSVAIGGEFLKNSGAKIYENISEFNITGIVETLSKVPFLFKHLKRVSNYIVSQGFEEVVLVDFPGFNLRLAKKLKKLNPNINITYLSPPQLWVWGSWRIKNLKKFCDNLIVIYPFEVDWYKQHGINQVEFLGNPLCDKWDGCLTSEVVKNQIVILPGSRKNEIIELMPMFAQIIRRVKLVYPNIKIFLPLAESLDYNFLKKKLRANGLYNHGQDVYILKNKEDKIKAMKESFLAITKPGTVTLELSLLNTPALIIYKVSWISYFLARIVVNVEYMGLPNLFLNKPVYKEFIQGDCKVDLIFDHIKKMHESYLKQDSLYRSIKSDLLKIKKDLCNKDLCNKVNL